MKINHNSMAAYREEEITSYSPLEWPRGVRSRYLYLLIAHASQVNPESMFHHPTCQAASSGSTGHQDLKALKEQ